jgi:hypothetical protein
MLTGLVCKIVRFESLVSDGTGSLITSAMAECMIRLHGLSILRFNTCPLAARASSLCTSCDVEYLDLIQKEFIERAFLGPIMAAPAAPAAPLPLSGPPQQGRGVQGQDLYWIVMPHPTAETLAQPDVKKPSVFDQVHADCGATLEEIACFLEPHASGLPHFILLGRVATQYRWKKVAEELLQKHRVHVSFGENVRTWAEGVVYGRD